MDRAIINEIADDFGMPRESIVRDISGDSICLVRNDSLSLCIHNCAIEGLKLEIVYGYKSTYWTGSLGYAISTVNRASALMLKDAIIANDFKMHPKPNWLCKPGILEFSFADAQKSIFLNRV